MSKFAVIFDMDGVLIDSTAINRESFDAILAADSLSMDKIERRSGINYKGGSLRDLLIAIESDYGIKFDLDVFSKLAGEYQFQKLNQLPPNKELRRLLDQLRSHHVPTAIATSSLKWRALKILEALAITEYFDAVVAADDVKEHKPSPHLFLEAAKRLKVAPNLCVVIEDADTGVEAGNRAGMAVVGFEQFNTTKGSLAKADLIANTFTDLSYQVLENLANRYPTAAQP